MKTFKGSVLKVFFTSLLLVVSFVMSSNSSLAYEKEVGRLSDIMIDNISNSGKQLVAVVDFNDLAGNVTKLGRFLAEEFSCALSNNKRGFEVIERIHLKKILEEHKLSLSGMIDRKKAQKIGEISGIEVLVIGTITSFGDSVRLSVKLLDTRTAKIIRGTRGSIPKTRAIEKLSEEGIDKSHDRGRKGVSVEAEGFTFTPLNCKRRGGRVTCTIGLTNNGSELRKLCIPHRASYFVDNYGNKYPVKVTIGGKGIGYSCVSGKFLPEVLTNIVFFAEDVFSKATNVTVAIYDHSFRKKIVGVRNIPITN